MKNNSLITVLLPKSNIRYIDPDKTIRQLSKERDLFALALRKLIVEFEIPATDPICKLLDSVYED